MGIWEEYGKELLAKYAKFSKATSYPNNNATSHERNSTRCYYTPPASSTQRLCLILPNRPMMQSLLHLTNSSLKRTKAPTIAQQSTQQKNSWPMGPIDGRGQKLSLMSSGCTGNSICTA